MSDRASGALSRGSAAPDPLIGRVIGERFRITALIARGGMGRVYRAEQSPLGRICAVKVLNPNYAGEHDPEFHKRFFLEASIASKLSHPNTVTVFDYGRAEDDIYYMAMEYLEGHTLHRAIRQAGYLPEARAVHIARQICRSLREAHALGVIHRDLKPANIFLLEHADEADFVKVLDFGLVKNVAESGEDLTQTGMFMGSPKYMAPEQIRGDRVDAGTDVYALGVMLYEMLTGKVPFDRPTSVNILMAHVHEDPPPMRETNPLIILSSALEEVVAACLAKDPATRLRSMTEVLEALKPAGVPSATATMGTVAVTERTSGPPSALSSSRGGARSDLLHASVPRPSLSSDIPAASAPLAPASPGGGSKGMLVAAMTCGLVVAGAIGYVAVRPSKWAPSEAAAPSPALQASAAVAVTPPSAPAAVLGPASAATPEPAPVTLRVVTEPDGASVKEGNVEVCASTPCEVAYKGSEADPDREHRLTLAHPGYRPETRTVKGADGPLVVRLSQLARATAPPPPRQGDVQAVPSGYKTDIPY